MRKNLSTQSMILGAFALLCSFGISVRADQFWSNDWTPNVVDENLTITADSTLTSASYDYVRITASTRDVTVTLTQDVIITATDSVPTLFLEALGYDIIFNVTYNLTFQGAAAPSTTPMFIAVRGGGNVIFNIDGGTSVTLGKNGTDGGSVKFYVIQDGTVVEINRNTDSDLISDIEFNLEGGSTIGYASDKEVGTGTDAVGTIAFNPTNIDIGRMLLQLADKAAVVISGRYIDGAASDSYDLVLDDIVTTTPAGCMAIFNITNDNTDASSRLLVVNDNQTLYPYQISHPTTTDMYGFILSCNGKIIIDEGSYLDYVGLALDKCFTGTTHNAPCSFDCSSSYLCQDCADADEATCVLPIDQVFKKRNPSALIVDGCQTSSAVAACIDMADESALVLRSGIDCEGTVNSGGDYPYTIDPNKRTPGAGNMVMDVEGCLTVAGTGQDQELNPTKIEVLSLYVTPTGATVLIDGTGNTNFPARTFAVDGDGVLRRYNSGYIFVNNNMVLCDTFLVHTDQNHKIYDNDDVRSEPTYVGGEAYRLTNSSRPRIIFSNSTFMIHTSLASTGVDFSVPNALKCCDETSSSCLVNADVDSCANSSQFIFYYNGYALDNGTGRQMILGTLPGSLACDCCNIINADSHIDIMQLPGQACTCGDTHELVMTVAPNNSTIIQGVPDDIDGQYSVNSIYLGQSSNISIGSPDGSVPAEPSCPTLTIVGSYFSFGSRGGVCNCPQMSNLTGQGGIFVDNHGTIQAVDSCGVNMGVMVTKSGDGVIDLPTPIVRYGCQMGEADWKLDLVATPTIIPEGTVLASYVLNWNTSCKWPNFVPFNCDCEACPSTPAIPANVTGLPVVLGEVDQLFVYGSRIGDPAHIKVGKGGNVRELIFPDSCQVGFAPTAVVVLEEGGRVGLGSAHTDADSLNASIVLGNNGVTVVANGNGCVYLNEDVVINNVCHIVQGPDFAASDRLFIASECCRTIRVKSTGVLDLSSFSTGKVELGGHVRLVLEPGATVVMGNVELKFSGQAGIFCEPVRTDLLPTTVPTDLTALDDFRVKFIGGAGTIRFTGCSYFTINENAFVGVETSSECAVSTDLTFILEDAAKWMIGYCSRLGTVYQVGNKGGAFQVGNTECQYERLVKFNLIIDGNDAEFAIGQEAFVGLGAVIASKLPNSVPNEWYVGQACNVDLITISIKNGVFSHNIIWDGNRSAEDFYLVGSALAIGTMGTYSLDFRGDPNRRLANLSRATIRGGGNLVLVADTVPTRLTIEDENTNAVGILASGPIFKVGTETYSGTGEGLFNFWRYADVEGTTLQLNSRTDVGPFVHNEMMAGYVDRGYIQRFVQIEIVGSAGATTDQAHTIDIGAAAVRLVPSTDAPRTIQDIRILA